MKKPPISRLSLVIIFLSVAIAIIIVAFFESKAVMNNARMHLAGGPKGQQSYISTSAVSKLYTEQTKATKNVSNNSLIYPQNKIILVVTSYRNSQGQNYFLIDGLKNPTIHIHRGVTIDLHLINKSNNSHGFEIVNASPPFRSSPTQYYAAQFRSFVVPLLGVSHGMYDTSEVDIKTYTTTSPGTYYYLSPVHAQAKAGMYGKMVII